MAHTAHTAGRTALLGRGRSTAATAAGGRRHPLVAVAMILPMAVLLSVLFGGVDAVVTQASSVAGMLGR
ncbi:hypothetical protein N566_00980 [Streptomycetaceae bacterium MP113-05]|nr:hypothetical protein N566_00980 [Streptomycetaceae bacterium MP113-05]